MKLNSLVISVITFINNYKKLFIRIIFLSFFFAWSMSAHAVIILDSTFKKSGFAAAEQLAMQPAFQALMHLESELDVIDGSGVWIGNYRGHGYVLTAAHMFVGGIEANGYTYVLRSGERFQGEKLFLHPLYRNKGNHDRTGFDLAVVQLSKEVTQAGAQPFLYSGTKEYGGLLTFMGYGYRGIGSKGQMTIIDTKNRAAAAQGVVTKVVDAKKNIQQQDDAGNYLEIWLPKEDGSLKDAHDAISTFPKTSLVGLLGSGDSGGPAWLQFNNDWVIVGINSDGTGNAKYGDYSWFARISSVQEWLRLMVPSLKFWDNGVR